MRERLRIAAALVLVAGLAIGLGIYLGASDQAPGALDQIYGSKLYARQLQQFGGKASILFDEFARWFASLWEGRRLGITIGALSVALSGALLYGAARAKD
ncbi:MAG: hypothetical protein ACM30H_13360 [Clostridia bacterium]